MALKIWLNGSMKKIDTNLHKPVIFLNGTKYKLDKAWTFVNGEKKEIWGSTGIQIDYISSTGSLGGGNLFDIGENWANVYYGRNVYRLDISNLSSPQLIQNVNWGKIVDFLPLQSSSTNNIFVGETVSGTLPSYNRLSVDETTGAITVLNTKNMSALRTYVGFTNNAVVTRSARTKSFQSTTVTYGTDFYFDNTLAHSTGREPSSASDTSGFLLYNKGGVQTDSTNVMVCLTGNYSTGAGAYKMSSSALTRQTGAINYMGAICDDNKVCASVYVGSSYSPRRANHLKLYDSTSYTQLYDYTSVNDGLIFLGGIDDCYYIIEHSNTESVNDTVKLIMLSKTDLSVVYEKELPNDPFNENNGKNTFWLNASVIPSLSKSGFLGISTYNQSTLGLRIVRFSGII